MAGLVDIAAVTEKVTVAGTEIEVPGVSAAGVAYLLARFPVLRKLMSGVEVKDKGLAAVGPDALAAILAAGTGAPGDADAEAAAAALPLEAQTDLLSVILRVTLPGGLGPFVKKIEALGLLVGPDVAVRSGKARGSKSRKRSKNLKPTATPKPGPTRRAR